MLRTITSSLWTLPHTVTFNELLDTADLTTVYSANGMTFTFPLTPDSVIDPTHEIPGAPWSGSPGSGGEYVSAASGETLDFTLNSALGVKHITFSWYGSGPDGGYWLTDTVSGRQFYSAVSPGFAWASQSQTRTGIITRLEIPNPPDGSFICIDDVILSAT